VSCATESPRRGGSGGGGPSPRRGTHGLREVAPRGERTGTRDSEGGRCPGRKGTGGGGRQSSIKGSCLQYHRRPAGGAREPDVTWCHTWQPGHLDTGHSRPALPAGMAPTPPRLLFVVALVLLLKSPGTSCSGTSDSPEGRDLASPPLRPPPRPLPSCPQPGKPRPPVVPSVLPGV
jgi:hypothetical protein